MNVLLELAQELGEESKAILTEIPHAWREVDRLLEAAGGEGRHPSTRDFFDQIRAGHRDLTEAIKPLPEAASGFYQLFWEADFGEKLAEYRNVMKGADPTKLADERLLALCYHKQATILAIPIEVVDRLASIQIFVFVAGLAHRDVLLAFLRRPTAFSTKVGQVMDLLKAATGDAVGSFIPILGIVQEMVRQSEPWIEGEIKRIEAAADVMDRAFAFDASLKGMREYSRFVQHFATLTKDAIEQSINLFETERSWLLRAVR